MVKAREWAGLVGWVVWFRRRRCAEVGMPGQTRDVGFQYCALYSIDSSGHDNAGKMGGWDG